MKNTNLNIYFQFSKYNLNLFYSNIHKKMSSNIPSVTSAPINSILGAHITAPAANATPISRSPRSPTAPHRPAAALEDPKDVTTAAFVLKDGTSFQGISFGSESKSISGECVFQTGKDL
jgi:carbamoyl-phosphate synthase/aspartate carbamoyltransferase